jgi:LPXTG-motif cell wall-anchored protein
VVEGVSWNQLVLSILGIIIVILGVFAFLFKKRK